MVQSAKVKHPLTGQWVNASNVAVKAMITQEAMTALGTFKQAYLDLMEKNDEKPNKIGQNDLQVLAEIEVTMPLTKILAFVRSFPPRFEGKFVKKPPNVCSNVCSNAKTHAHFILLSLRRGSTSDAEWHFSVSHGWRPLGQPEAPISDNVIADTLQLYKDIPLKQVFLKPDPESLVERVFLVCRQYGAKTKAIATRVWFPEGNKGKEMQERLQRVAATL